MSYLAALGHVQSVFFKVFIIELHQCEQRRWVWTTMTQTPTRLCGGRSLPAHLVESPLRSFADGQGLVSPTQENFDVVLQITNHHVRVDLHPLQCSVILRGERARQGN
jgi:hypothetical protein